MNKRARFYFHGSLNDFLHHTKRKTSFGYTFSKDPSVKDAMEAIGVPHPEVDKILVNGSAVDFSYPLQHQDQVEVFPLELEKGEKDRDSRLHPLPPPRRFILDVHLGKLARVLRMLGFDSLYENDYADATIAAIAEAENRIVLTRDVGLLKHKAILWGYWLRSQQAEEQLQEVVRYFKLEPFFCPFSRCMVCNGFIAEVPKEKILDRLLPQTKQHFEQFFQCGSCERIYWKGSHYERMQELLEGRDNF